MTGILYENWNYIYKNIRKKFKTISSLPIHFNNLVTGILLLRLFFVLYFKFWSLCFFSLKIIVIIFAFVVVNGKNSKKNSDHWEQVFLKKYLFLKWKVFSSEMRLSFFWSCQTKQTKQNKTINDIWDLIHKVMTNKKKIWFKTNSDKNVCWIWQWKCKSFFQETFL